MKKGNIFIITHIAFDVKYHYNYIPLQVGKKFTKIVLPYQSDDTGKNIALKNNFYCELTGIYWVWKNFDIKDYVGFVHYRRFFKQSLFSSKLLTEKKINKYLKNYDIIVPKKFNFPISIWDNYFKGGVGKEEDLKKLKEIINKKYNEYINSFNEVMNSYSATYCNMFITSKELFNKYAEWLFDILHEMEKITDLSEYTKAEARIYGYLSEILLNVWIKQNKLKVKYLDIIKTDDSNIDKLKWKWRMLKWKIIGYLKKNF